LTVGLQILLVEDHKDTAESTAIGLRLFGYEVHIASDGPHALTLAQTQQPDVVVLDIGLPGMNGYEVAKRLRQEQKNRVLLIATTGYGRSTEERLKSYEAGIDLHLTKPVGLEELAYYLRTYQAVAHLRSR
jgi:CheY-like chemotaxis protein